VNAESLENYKDLLQTTTADLEDRLESIDEKLEMIFKQSVPETDSDAAELRSIKEEQLSTRRCLEICAQLSDHINQIQLGPKGSSNGSGPNDPPTFPERVVDIGLQECKNSLTLAAARLEKHMQELMDRMVAKSHTKMSSKEDVAELAKLQEEWKSIRQSMDICTNAENYLKENISTIENYATGDAVQFMVSTNGKTIRGVNRGLGWRTRQYGGHVSDASLQQLSRDLTSMTIRGNGVESASQGDAPSAEVKGEGKESNPGFDARYGRGLKLAPKSVATTSSMRRADSG
jgi:hypothetical protein